jgi:hypothetical protein
MNGPPIAPEDGPEPGTGPDPLDRAYREASARDSARPDPRVRAAILARARGSVRPAANDPRWRWQAAAGIAAIGFVGLLSWHFVRFAPPEQVAATATGASEAPAIVAPEAAPAPASAPAPSPMPVPALAPPPASPAASRVVPSLAAPSAAPSAAPELSRPVMPEIAAAGSPPRIAEHSPSRNGVAAALRAADAATDEAPRHAAERVLRTVRALYPQWFEAPAPSGRHPAVTVAIVLNADGSVYASARSATAARTPSPGDAAARIAQEFGGATGPLTQSGVMVAAEGVTVIYGIRAAPAGGGP